MKHSHLSKTLAMLLAVMLLVSVLPLNALAVKVEYDDSYGGSDYYKVISKKDWELAPGVAESEIVLNNEAGTRRQVLHTVAVDINNPYTKVIAGYKGMWPQAGNYGTQSTSVQALEAEKLGYGNVVAATNTTLNWYTAQYYIDNPHMIGEPLGYTILDGEIYHNSQMVFNEATQSFSAGDGTKTVIVINYDNHPITGEPRPDDMPKVWIRATTDPLTGWEYQAIPVSFTFLVKPDANGVPQNMYAKNPPHGPSDIASRTFVGVKADGTLIITVSDGEQAPYSAGFTSYEMAEYMIKMGCVIAANCDGGGSTTFCSQRPGEELKVNCSLSDGGERPTTSTILVISTAPADGVFARANIASDYEYYTPGSSVTFTAMGTDAVGTKVDIPADVEWAIKEDGMGTIANGVFVSNGTEGVVTAQMLYNGQVVGEHSINIAAPEEIYFEQPVVTIPFGKTAVIPVKAAINGGLVEIGLSAKDITFTTTNEALGQFDGLNFVAVDEENAPADLTSTVTATLVANPALTATVQLNLGKASEVLWDFEDGQVDVDEWNVINSRTNDYRDYYLKLSLADRTNGQVHDGDHSLRLEINGLSSKKSDSSDYAWIRLGVDGEAVVLENARRVGFWLYVPEDNIQCWVQGHYMTDSNGDGTYDNIATVSMMESENVYYNIDESGWHYMSMDISAFEKVALKYSNQFNLQDADGYTTGQTSEKGEFFLAIITHRTKNNLLWQTNGTINGPYTYYLDSFTVDYSEAVDDRENPVFETATVNGTKMFKRDVVATTTNALNVAVAVADATTLADAMGVAQPLYNVSGLNPATAKIYVDGVEVPSTFANGVMSANVTVADGYHRVKFEICDNAGNKSVIIRVVKVESSVDASTIKVVPADTTLDRIPFGSIYWMNLEATAIETIDTVETVIDLNSVNHWQLDHMVLADGFSAEYTIAKETNTATITITRTGINTQTGAAVLAQLPVRIIYFDTDIKVPGFTAETYWTKYNFFAQDMKMDVDMGVITHVDGDTSTFSNEEFHVDTEMYTTNQAIDKEYFAAHGTTHVHTPAAIADQAPTCAQPGYTGRTFCEGCNSVVDWGTTVPATGHEFGIVNDQIACHCGIVSDVTGLQTFDGKNYYAINGKLLGGWQMVDEEWYLFDEKTFAGVDGEQYSEKAILFTFDNGRLVDGAWVKVNGNWRYWYGPSYFRKTSPTGSDGERYEIHGKLYIFNKSGYLLTGVVRYYEPSTKEYVYYDCGTDGVATLLTGPYNGYFYIDGVKQTTYKLVKSSAGDFYFIDSGHRIAVDKRIYLSAKFVEGHTYDDGTPLTEGYYEFDAEGKMVIKNGPIDGYFYVNNVRQTNYKLVNYEGAFYFIDAGHKLAVDKSVYLTASFVNGHTYADGTPIAEGTYTFDAEGKMVIRNGVIGDYLYINNVRQTAYKLMKYDGNFYFINDGHKIFKNGRLYLSAKFVAGHTYADGTPLAEGYYDFDAEGKLVVKNGPVGGYFYINNVRQNNYKLVNYEGSYYFIDAGHRLAVDKKVYLSSKFVAGHTYADGTPLTEAYYTFGSDGKMVITTGIVGDYLYINNTRQTAYKLIEFEGNHYFISDGHKIAKNCRVYLSEKFVAGHTYADGTALTAGYYEFDAEGKMIGLNGPMGSYFYRNGVKLLAYQLVEYEGNFYFISNGNKIATDTKVWLSAKFVAGKTYADGSMIEVGYHYFDASGKMVK